MRARWFIAAAGAVGAAHLLWRPRPNPGQVAALDNSGRLPDSLLPAFTPATFPHLSYAKPIDIGVQRPGHTCIPGLIGSSYGCRACNDGRKDGIVVDVLWPEERLEETLRDSIADTVRAGRALEPAAIWNRICAEQGLGPETAAVRSLLYWQEISRVARAGQLDGEWADIYDIPTADPLEPT